MDGCAALGLIDLDPGCILCTSGSTGRAKGVMLSQQNLVSAARSVAQHLGYRACDRIFVTIPLTFVYGMHLMTMAALVRATVIIERNFLKPLFALDRLAKSGATVMPVVPSMVPMIEAWPQGSVCGPCGWSAAPPPPLTPGTSTGCAPVSPQRRCFPCMA